MATYLWGPEKSLIVPTPDLAFLMHDDDSGRCQMHRVGVPELPLIEWAKQFADPKKIFVDCGAHMGAYSILLADHFKQVYAFEAQRRTYFQLCGNIFVNEKQNINPIHAAVTSQQDTEKYKLLKLNIVSEDGGGSTICDPPAGAPDLGSEWVVPEFLDNVASAWDAPVGLIKLDIEGNELSALRGAQNVLMHSDYPPIIFEANNHPEFEPQKRELFMYLFNLGYEIAEIRPFDNMYVAKFNQKPAATIRHYSHQTSTST